MIATNEFVVRTGEIVEIAGVVVIVIGIVFSTAVFFVRWLPTEDMALAVRSFRRGIARSVLLGLEILVAGDIIGTVALEPSFRSVGVLAVIVAIRTFLSFTLELEITGSWPWQAAAQDEQRRTAVDPS